VVRGGLVRLSCFIGLRRRVEGPFDGGAGSPTLTLMTDFSLFLPGLRRAAGPVLAGVLAVVSVACQTDGDGNPTAQVFRGADVTIRGAGAMEVRQAVADVMTENEFRLASPIGNVMTFEKDGTRHDEWMYGSYGSRPMRQRVIITITMGDDPETIEVVASGKVVREYGNMSGEETGYLFAGGAMRYSKYLDMVKKRVESQVRAAPTF
jgi:hypothetical protein